MKESKESSNNNFLERFITAERYLQNPPLEIQQFIQFCRKRGIETDEQELEFFEKEKLLFPIARIERSVVEEERIRFAKNDGKEGCRPAKYGLQAGETLIEKYKVKNYSCYDLFKEYYLKPLVDLLKVGLLFDPSTRPFQPWESFVGEELGYKNQKIVSFYSSFQIYWLEKLKKSFSFKINFATTTCITDYTNVLKEFSDVAKRQLTKEHEDFNQFLKFLLLIQSAYYPYARSGSGEITIKGDDKEWYKIRRNLNLQEELDFSGLEIKDIVRWYQTLSDKGQRILGIKRGDWVQLFKNISWRKKDTLEGNIRLGIEYLQWSVMLKRVVEEYLQKEVLDIDECTDFSADDVIRFNPSQMNQYPRSLRTIRNEEYFDPKENKNYYYDRYRRLFYLANTFGIDYQPRIMVFVEGETEEKLLPKVFEWYHDRPENLGVEIVNIKGMNKFFGQRVSIRDPKSNKYLKGFLNNFNHLIRYNLNKWQTIPFFIGDNENDISFLLKEAISIDYEGEQYKFPDEWKFLWGIDNGNEPFVGKNFELANFGNQEIATALTEVLKRGVTEGQIEELRIAGKGTKDLGADVDNDKIKIAEKLIDNLFDWYDKNKDSSVLDRPIFKVVEKIIELAVLNHPPVSREIELENKKIITERYLAKHLCKTQ